MDYFKDGQEFAQKYVWNKFKNSWVTLVGGLATVAMPIGVALADLPGVFQVFTLIPLAAVASSFYWYKIANAEKYAKEGAEIFQEHYKEKKIEALMQEYRSISFHNSASDRKLKNDLLKVFNDFLRSINEQAIISDIFKSSSIHKAEDAFKSGVTLLSEMKDITALLDYTSLSKLNKDLDKAKSKEDKKFINEKIELYNKNEATMDELRVSLKELIHSFEVSKLNLAHATSSFESKNDVNEKMKSMVAAMDAAKRVQQRVKNLGSEKDYTMYDKIIEKGK